MLYSIPSTVDISNAIGSYDESPPTKSENDSSRNELAVDSQGTPQSVSVAKEKTKDIDEHNDVCEVCERGGDLICCDTCSLVFHLKCLRPKLSAVPQGDWSCAYCILDVSSSVTECSAIITVIIVDMCLCCVYVGNG